MSVWSSLARVIGYLMVVIGLIGLVSPDAYVRFASFWAEPPGLYIVAAVQLVIGLALFRAAPRSRSPVGLGVLGAFMLAEAVLMPLLGRGRTVAIAHWWSAQSLTTLRFWAVLELGIGLLVVLAVTPRRRGLRPVTTAT